MFYRLTDGNNFPLMGLSHPDIYTWGDAIGDRFVRKKTRRNHQIASLKGRVANVPHVEAFPLVRDNLCVDTAWFLARLCRHFHGHP